MAGRIHDFLRKTPLIRLPERGAILLGTALKPLMPRSLNGRFIFIIIAPVILVQIISTYLYMERYSQQVTRRLSNSVGGEIAFLIAATEAEKDPAALQALFDRASEFEGLNVRLEPGAALPAPKPVGFFSFISDVMAGQLRENISHPFWFDLESKPSWVEIRVLLDGQVMVIEVRRSRILATNWHIFLGWVVFAAAVFVGIALLFLRIQTRAILRLAVAAEQFGKGRDVPDFKPSGATEVRNAAHAVIEMRDRINAYVAQRTEMLAGVSHDMRTPLTRMKLQLAMLGDSEDIQGMKADIAEMEYMLQEYLDFARGASTEETSQVNVGAVLEEIRAGVEMKGRHVFVDAPPDLSFPLKRMTFKRCLSNLVNNAVAYGKRVEVTALVAESGALVLRVDDDGPGIPEARREEAFRPFHRLDEGRNLEKGGSGLGLAIALDAAKGHGGDIALETSPLGGLRAVVTLPG